MHSRLKRQLSWISLLFFSVSQKGVNDSQLGSAPIKRMCSGLSASQTRSVTCETQPVLISRPCFLTRRKKRTYFRICFYKKSWINHQCEYCCWFICCLVLTMTKFLRRVNRRHVARTHPLIGTSHYRPARAVVARLAVSASRSLCPATVYSWAR